MEDPKRIDREWEKTERPETAPRFGQVLSLQASYSSTADLEKWYIKWYIGNVVQRSE